MKRDGAWATPALTATPTEPAVRRLLREVRACTLCRAHLPHGPRPVPQLHPNARIHIAGQAPGSRAHAGGVPFRDANGARLRDSMGVDEPTFRDPARIAILPMGFCHPGAGRSGDPPPRPECARAWRSKLMAVLAKVELTLVIGRYAQGWHLGAPPQETLTETVAAWREYWPALVPLPQPSPRNHRWLRRNPRFESDLLRALRRRIRALAG